MCDPVRSSIRPVDASFQKPLASMVISGLDPNLTDMFESVKESNGVSDPDQMIMRPFRPSPSHTPIGSIRGSRVIVQAVTDRAGSRESSRFVAMAQIARAFLLASAIATSILGLRDSFRAS